MTDVHATCASLPGAIRTYPFGEETAVYKVGGKMFALMRDVPTSINLKAEPAEVTGLVETYAAVERGYHMNKKHWNTIILTGQLPLEEIQGLIVLSYNLVSGNQ